MNGSFNDHNLYVNSFWSISAAFFNLIHPVSLWLEEVEGTKLSILKKKHTHIGSLAFTWSLRWNFTFSIFHRITFNDWYFLKTTENIAFKGIGLSILLIINLWIENVANCSLYLITYKLKKKIKILEQSVLMNIHEISTWFKWREN